MYSGERRCEKGSHKKSSSVSLGASDVSERGGRKKGKRRFYPLVFSCLPKYVSTVNQKTLIEEGWRQGVSRRPLGLCKTYIQRQRWKSYKKGQLGLWENAIITVRPGSIKMRQVRQVRQKAFVRQVRRLTWSPEVVHLSQDVRQHVRQVRQLTDPAETATM